MNSALRVLLIIPCLILGGAAEDANTLLLPASELRFAVSQASDDMETVHLEFTVKTRPLQPKDTAPEGNVRRSAEEIATSLQGADSCVVGAPVTIECVVFHYTIQNMGKRPVLILRHTCYGMDISTEYRRNDSGGWKTLPAPAVVCSRNIRLYTEIAAGGTTEGEFLLPQLAFGLDLSPLRGTDGSQLRFSFQTDACFISPDAKPCVMPVKRTPSFVSNVVTVPVS